MRNCIFLLSIFFSITIISAQSLVLVKEPTYARADFPIIEVIEGQDIILAEENHMSRLKTRGVKYEILDSNVQNKEYYIVHPFFNTPDDVIDYSTAILAKYGRVLATFNKVCLMEANSRDLHSMSEYHVKLNFLELEPMNFNTEGNTVVPADKPAYNPYLQEMLNKVSPDTVLAFEKELTSFQTRHVQSRCSENEVIPYMKEFYLNYGCDTVITLSLGGSYSDEVIGIRYGFKNPTLDTFLLLGGHVDNIISGGYPDVDHEGANDNATGQVAVMEACRVHDGYTFDYTIIYCAFNGEEKGLHGSKAVCNYLQGKKTIGGNFSYDMFGMSETDIKFRVYQYNTGAQQFVSKMKEIKNAYGLLQPVSIELTASNEISSDARNLWQSGFATVAHNFGFSGAGRTHTADDNFKSNYYDKEFQAETAKLGILTTAFYAGVQPPVSNKDFNTVSSKPLFTSIQTPNNIVFNFDGNIQKAGKIEIFNLKGSLVKSINTNGLMKRVLWDITNNSGAKIAKNSIMLVKYSTSEKSSMLKLVVN